MGPIVFPNWEAIILCKLSRMTSSFCCRLFEFASTLDHHHRSRVKKKKKTTRKKKRKRVSFSVKVSCFFDVVDFMFLFFFLSPSL